MGMTMYVTDGDVSCKKKTTTFVYIYSRADRAASITASGQVLQALK